MKINNKTRPKTSTDSLKYIPAPSPLIPNLIALSLAVYKSDTPKSCMSNQSNKNIASNIQFQKNYMHQKLPEKL